VPGRGDVAVDPSALDPVDVATALRDVPSDHLRKVMAGPFRPVVLGEIFRRLPDFVDARKAAGAELVVAFRLTGGAEPERYVVAIDRGTATVVEGAEEVEGLERHATITCAGHDFLRLATGHLSPVKGVVRGTLKVKGDKARALQLSSLIDFPRPR
jgi:putative sterol carrier protein